MTKRFISILAIVVMALCLISGGCTSLEGQDLKSWQDLIKIKPDQGVNNEQDLAFDLITDEDKNDSVVQEDTIDIDLYFIDADGKKLILEKRTITKEEGLARSTLEELIKGPLKQESLGVFPENTELLDINIKPEGLCKVDFNSQLTTISSEHQEKLAVYAIVNTLGQFPTVQEVVILINGEEVDTIAGYIDVSSPIKPDYNV